MSRIVREEDIDNEILIQEIELRPGLFNKSLKDYSNVTIKKQLWEEVCIKVYFNIWGELSSEEKSKAGVLAQKRWKNLRTCFARELRAQKDTKSGQPASKRKKYVYYDQLLFLLPTIEMRETEGNAAPVQVEIEEETENQIRPPLRHKKADPQKKSYEERLITLLEKKKENDQETDFALSLVPLLKSLPKNQVITAQIQILQVIQNLQQTPATSQVQEHQPISPVYVQNRPVYNYQSSPVQPWSSVVSYQPQPGPSGLQTLYQTPRQTQTTTVPYKSPSFIHLENVSSPDTNRSSVQSYVSNFSVDSEEIYDICEENSIELPK